MPDQPPDSRRSARSSADRATDHASIDRLTVELLPALIAKLGATGLGELEVHEGAWRVRLRRPASPKASGPASGQSAGRDRQDRAPRSLHHALEGATARTDSRSVATSPAVGLFQPRPDLTAGTSVRSGDRLGAVDMLGVAQEVVAPVDGIVGATLVEPGDAVEYGQELLVIEFAPVAASTNGSGPTD